MQSPPHLRRIISLPNTGLVMSLASQSFASITTLNYNFSFVMSSVAIMDVGAQLKSIGDALNSAHAKHVMGLTSRVFFAWCLRALYVMYEAVKWITDGPRESIWAKIRSNRGVNPKLRKDSFKKTVPKGFLSAYFQNYRIPLWTNEMKQRMIFNNK